MEKEIEKKIEIEKEIAKENFCEEKKEPLLEIQPKSLNIIENNQKENLNLSKQDSFVKLSF